MQKSIITALLILFGISLFAQRYEYNPNEHYTGFYFPGYEKLVLKESVLYRNNSSESRLDYISVISGKSSQRQSTKIKFIKNNFGHPYGLFPKSYFGISYIPGSSVKIFRQDSLKSSPPPLKKYISRVPCFRDLQYNFFESRRNCIIYLDKYNEEHKYNTLHKNLFKFDFVISNDTTIDYFMRDNLRFTWWRNHGRVMADGCMVNGRVMGDTCFVTRQAQEIATFTFLPENHPDLELPHKTEHSMHPEKYIYNAFLDSMGYKRLSNYGYKMILMHFLQPQVRDSLLDVFYSRQGEIHTQLYWNSPVDDIEQKLDSTFDEATRAMGNMGMVIDTTSLVYRRIILSKLSEPVRDTLYRYLKRYDEPRFFSGNFKVIKQNEHFFVIHEPSSNIFYLSENQIIRIGVFLHNREMVQLRNKDFFIEDKDNNRLIIFGTVEWFRKDYPMPNVKTINTQEEYDKSYRYAIEKLYEDAE